MNTKLTLTVDQDIIIKAKKYAKSKGRTLSDIIENYLKMITKEASSIDEAELSLLVKSLKGSFKMPDNFHYKEELNSALSKKYLNE